MHIRTLGDKSNITIFLGAGASVQFGNPTTKVFKEQLIEKKFFDEQFLPLLKLKLFPDIEYVLQCLKEILELENNQLGKFLNNNEFNFEIKSLIEDVKLSQTTTKLFMSSAKSWHYQIMRHIFETYKIADESSTNLKDFFNSLFSCIDKYSNRIDIGTTNYDLAVESFCNLSGSVHRPVDGFEISGTKYTWNPQLFQKDTIGKTVYLYKIHGSLNWRGKNNDLIKFDSMPSFEADDALSPSTVIAPTLSPKDAYDKEPFSTLLRGYSEKLMNSDVCIVIGFSFRDHDISEHFRSFVEKGKRLIIVSPSCHRDYVVNLFRIPHDGTDTEVKGYANSHGHSENRNVIFIDLPCDEKNNPEIFRRIDSALSTKKV